MSIDINNSGMLLDFILSSLYKKNPVPSDFHAQAKAIKDLQRNDVSGLVNSLINFQVNASNVNWYVKTGNDNLDTTFKKWMKQLNSDFNGSIPTGINALASEYYKERWLGASFPILKILQWDSVDGYELPTQMAFVNGAEVYSKANNDDFVDLGSFKYYLGSKESKQNSLGKGCIITKPFARWHDEYPNVYLIQNGVFYNWKLLYSLKYKQYEVLEQILPYLLLVQKGTEGLATSETKIYDDDDLKAVVKQMEELIVRMQDSEIATTNKNKTGVRVSQFDEEIKHLIPDLETILKAQLTTSFEKGILGGMGFIDIAEATSSSRRESMLNPKPFMNEIVAGVGLEHNKSGFGQIMQDLMIMIQKRNANRKKYAHLDPEVFHTKPKALIDKDFRDFLLSTYNRGAISKKTLVETGLDENYLNEVDQRKLEDKEGHGFYMYPPVVQNQEQAGLNEHQDPDKDVKVPQEKLDSDAKLKYNKASIFIDGLEGSPYKSIAKLPKAVKDALPSTKQRRQWMSAFNGAYNYYLGKFGDKSKAETLAYKTAWSQFKRNT